MLCVDVSLLLAIELGGFYRACCNVLLCADVHV